MIRLIAYLGARRLLSGVAVGVVAWSTATGRPAQAQELDALFDRYWSAESVSDRSDVAAEIIESRSSFDAVFDRLQSGGPYRRTVPKGRIVRERIGTNGLPHPYIILIPEDYSPDRRWPVRLNLHGGMGAPEWEPRDGAWAPGWTEARNQIVVLPAGWWDSMWWEYSQVENIEAILAEVRRSWNVDENRVVLYGNSDGAAALFFYAMRAPDRFAGFAGHVGPPALPPRLRRG